MSALRFYTLGFFALAACDTAAHLFFKLAATTAAPLQADAAWLLRVLGTPWVYGAVACYVATFFLWMTLLRRAPIGPAFAASHLDVVGVLLASMLLLGEHIGLAQWAGAVLIGAGIVCLAFSEAREGSAA